MSVIAVLVDTFIASLYFWIRWDTLSQTNIAEGDVGIVFLLAYGFQAVFIGGCLGGLVKKNKVSLSLPPMFYIVVMLVNYRIETINMLTITIALMLLATISGIIIAAHTVAMLITSKIAEKTYLKPLKPVST